VRGTVAVLVCDGVPDSSGDVFRKEGVEVPDGEVEVSMYMDPSPQPLTLPLGRAKLHWREDVLFADLELLPAPLKENGLRILYPSIEGVIVARKEHLIDKCSIRRINLHVGRNSDHRIGTLFDQGVR
jgi:hypothetical protein